MISLAILAGVLGSLASVIVTLRYAIATGANKLEAQSIAFDEAWSLFNWPYKNVTGMNIPNLQDYATNATALTTPVSTNSYLYPASGTIRRTIALATNYCDIIVYVWWRPRLSGAYGTNSVSYTVRRYDTER